MDREMGILMAQLGGTDHPRGVMISAYREALRSLRVSLVQAGPVGAWDAVETLRIMRGRIEQGTRDVLLAAEALGASEAEGQLDADGVRVRAGLVTGRDTVDQALAAIMATVDSQTAAAKALIATGAEPELVTGNESQQGVLRPGVVLAMGWFWVAGVAMDAWAWLVGQRPSGTEFRKQAVAAVDERTTRCCLRVHGQVQALDDPYHVTAEPRFAEWQQHPPFHWRCRTAEALVRKEDAGDGLTQAMVTAALDELAAREITGARVEIHPANATSGRQRVI